MPAVPTANLRSMDDSLRAALLAASKLENLGVRWFLGGSLASSIHGIPRATFDADLMADLRPQHVRPFLKSLGDAWYADEGAIREAIQARASFNLIHLDTAMKVDVFLPKPRVFDGGEFGRSLQIDLGADAPVHARVCCPEDIVCAKLEWFRLGGEQSERQWMDILGVLRLNEGKLDETLLQQSAAELGVLDLLEKALIEARG